MVFPCNTQGMHEMQSERDPRRRRGFLEAAPCRATFGEYSIRLRLLADAGSVLSVFSLSASSIFESASVSDDVNSCSWFDVVRWKQTVVG